MELDYNHLGILESNECIVLGLDYCEHWVSEKVIYLPFFDLLILGLVVLMPLLSLFLIYKFNNLRNKKV